MTTLSVSPAAFSAIAVYLFGVFCFIYFAANRGILSAEARSSCGNSWSCCSDVT